MNTFKRKALMSAVLGTLGAAGSAQAVVLNDQTGTGQVLYYPHYTVNSVNGNAWNTLLAVTNSTTAVKVVKVRFREGKNSREVLDFNLYLSPNDMWTAGIIPASASDTSAGRLVTSDVSCTNPPIPAAGVDFRNFGYTGANSDGLAGGVDRTREGYFEMIEMGVLDPNVGPGSAAVHTAPSNAPSCAGLTGASLPAVGAAVTAPTGGMFGSATLINVNSGRDTSYKAKALDAWRNAPIYVDLTTDTPRTDQAFPPTSAILTNNSVYLASWSASGVANAGARAVSSVFMHTDVMNEFVLDNVSRSNTDWVLTFPTRLFFVTGAAGSSTASAPFTNVLTTNGACEAFTFTFFNREEGTLVANDFSPFQSTSATTGSLCWESTVLSIRSGASHSPTSSSTSLVLGSSNVSSVNIQSSGFQNGWADVHFGGANASTVGLLSDATSVTIRTQPTFTGAAIVGAQRFLGLPVTGFMIRTFDNGNLTCGTATCQGNYGGSVEHSYRDVATP
jgi:hypothetical protein